MNNADMPAMPISEEETDRLDEGVTIHTGLTKREMFAMHAMQGYMASGAGRDVDPDNLACFAVETANALLKALEDKQPLDR